MRLKSGVDESNYESIEVSIQRTISTHEYCCICSATKNITTSIQIDRKTVLLSLGVRPRFSIFLTTLYSLNRIKIFIYQTE